MFVLHLSPPPQWKIRRVLAYSLHELARILGPETTIADLFPTFEEYCTKDVDDVKIGALSHLAEFFEVWVREGGGYVRLVGVGGAW